MSGFFSSRTLLGVLLTFVWFFAQAKEHRAMQTGKPIASSSTPDTVNRRA
jgi:hypothetical protein